jgi:hypothetical protein
MGAAIATLAAVVTVAGAFFIQGYSAAKQAAAVPAGVAASPAATLAPEIVYVNPAPPQQVVNVAPSAPPAAPPPVIHVIVPSVGGDDGGSDN